MASRLQMVNVDQLLPNTLNPRHSPVENSVNAIQALMDRMPRKILSLAKDIATFGLDPSSLPIVVEEDGFYIALEGNRRVAALLLMRDPRLVQLDATTWSSFEELRSRDVVPEEIPCIVFDEREEADHWLELRHTGENEGAGIVRWGAPEQQRFRRQRGSQVEVAMRFAEAMRSLYPDEIAFLRDVDRVESELSTTLGRLIQNPERRAHLGFDQRDGLLYVRYDPDDIFPIVERVFHDLSTGAENVTSFRDRSYMDDYVATVLSGTGHPLARLRQAVLVDDWASQISSSAMQGADNSAGTSGSGAGSESDDQSENADADGGRSSRRQRRREERRIFQGVVLSYVDLRVSDVLREAQRLNIDTSPNLCAVMLRVILDLVTSSFYDYLGRSNGDNSEFKQKIRACANRVDPSVSDPDLARARLLIESDGALSPKTMNGFVHGWASAPLASEVRALSAAYGPLLTKIDDYMRDNPRQ